MQEVRFTVHVFREGEMYVAHALELDISGCGTTKIEARRSIRDAVKGFLETSDGMGTLSDVLEEAGYRIEEGEWHAPQFVAFDHLSVGLR